MQLTPCCIIIIVGNCSNIFISYVSMAFFDFIEKKNIKIL